MSVGREEEEDDELFFRKPLGVEEPRLSGARAVARASLIRVCSQSPVAPATRFMDCPVRLKRIDGLTVIPPPGDDSCSAFLVSAPPRPSAFCSQLCTLRSPCWIRAARLCVHHWTFRPPGVSPATISRSAMAASALPTYDTDTQGRSLQHIASQPTYSRVLDRVEQRVAKEGLEEGAYLEVGAQLEDEGGDQQLEQQQDEQVDTPHKPDDRLHVRGRPQLAGHPPRVRGGQAAADRVELIARLLLRDRLLGDGRVEEGGDLRVHHLRVLHDLRWRDRPAQLAVGRASLDGVAPRSHRASVDGLPPAAQLDLRLRRHPLFITALRQGRGPAGYHPLRLGPLPLCLKHRPLRLPGHAPAHLLSRNARHANGSASANCNRNIHRVQGPSRRAGLSRRRRRRRRWRCRRQTQGGDVGGGGSGGGGGGVVAARGWQLPLRVDGILGVVAGVRGAVR
eukprot:scaffold72176_cov68-Phaeocystis_antarctica.AAC.7